MIKMRALSPQILPFFLLWRLEDLDEAGPRDRGIILHALFIPDMLLC